MKLVRYRRGGPVVRAARERIRRCEDDLLAAQEEGLRALDGLLRDRPDGWEHSAEERFAVARTMAQARSGLEHVRKGRPPVEKTMPAARPAHDGEWRVQISTLFMLSSLAFLTEEFATKDRAGRERMHLVTGSVTTDGTYVISHAYMVPLAEQRASYVKLQPRDSHRQIIELDEVHGHPLMGMFHSHPGSGAAATSPSSTDIANQARFEALGIRAIAGICVKDGFFRFWTNDKPFALDVYGKGYRLLQDDPCMKVVALEPVEETSA